MRQPLWVINSSLLFLFLLGQIVYFLIYVSVPRRVSLEPDIIKTSDNKTDVVVVIKNIYEQNDLFATYIAPLVALPNVIVPTIPVMPEAPAVIPLKIPVEPEKVFIAPLAVVLKGVMYNKNNPDHSVAIIQFQDSKEEINYKVGQLINDAQILKVYPNRVIVVRANGQQETLYLREIDAGKDMMLETAKEISQLTVSVSGNQYSIPIDKFTAHVKSLGQFIDLLDLMTVYQKGKSIGCRVGKAGKDSLALKLGLLKDDIIQQVAGLPVTDIASRVLIFDHVLQKKVGDSIEVKIDRGGKSLELTYVLVRSTSSTAIPVYGTSELQQKTTIEPVIIDGALKQQIEQERQKILEHKLKFAPTVHQIEQEERRKIMQARHREMIANGSASGVGMGHNGAMFFNGARG